MDIEGSRLGCPYFLWQLNLWNLGRYYCSFCGHANYFEFWRAVQIHHTCDKKLRLVSIATLYRLSSLYILTMTRQTISKLLREDPIDWIKVKKRAKSCPNETNKNFIHKLCLQPSMPPLFLDWALALPQAPSQLLRKSGLYFRGKTSGSSSTPLELCLRRNGNRVPYSTFARIVQATHKADPKDSCVSVDVLNMDIDKLRVLLETYGTKHFEDEIEDFLLLPFVEEEGLGFCGQMLDIDYEQGAETRLEVVLRAASRLWECERTSHGVFCLSHTFLVAVLPRYSARYDLLACPSDMYFILKRIIGIISPRDFCAVDDQEGNTLLHYVMQYSGVHLGINEDNDFLVCELSVEDMPDIDHEDELSGADDYWRGLINLLLREQQERQPFTEWCSSRTMMANKKGQTPLHLALLNGLPHAMVLVSAGEEEVMYQELHPFQLAATAGSMTMDDSQGCCCARCVRCEKKEVAVVTNTYALLRMKPDIILPFIACHDDAGTTRSGLLHFPLYKQIVMKELQVARMSRQIQIMKNALKESNNLA